MKKKSSYWDLLVCFDLGVHNLPQLHMYAVIFSPSQFVFCCSKRYLSKCEHYTKRSRPQPLLMELVLTCIRHQASNHLCQRVEDNIWNKGHCVYKLWVLQSLCESLQLTLNITEQLGSFIKQFRNTLFISDLTYVFPNSFQFKNIVPP